MKEFNLHVKKILEGSDNCRANEGEMIMISGPTKKIDSSYKFHNRSREPGNYNPTLSEILLDRAQHALHERCELCDFSVLNCSIFNDSLVIEKSNYVRWDQSSGRYLCNLCASGARSGTSAEICEEDEELIEKISEEYEVEIYDDGIFEITSEEELLDLEDELCYTIDNQEIKELSKARKYPEKSYVDAIDDQLVEVKVFKATHPKIKQYKLTEEQKEQWREEYAETLKPKGLRNYKPVEIQPTVSSVSDDEEGQDR